MLLRIDFGCVPTCGSRCCPAGVGRPPRRAWMVWPTAARRTAHRVPGGAWSCAKLEGG